MGFVNFNGAKWVYAAGLGLFGHKDFSAIGIPPNTYEIWKKYEGAPLPQGHPLYPLLLHARLLSAFIASAGLCLMFLFVYLTLNGDYIAAIFSTLLLRIHPIVINIATHAFADSMLLASELLVLILIVKLFTSHKRPNNKIYALLGAALGYSVSVKINAAMFYSIILVNFALWYFMHKISLHTMVRGIIISTIVAGCTFTLLHPNFFFYPTYTPIQMISDRIQITHMHVAYFSIHDPSHVLHTIPQRLSSMASHIFTPITLFFFALGLAGSLFFLTNKNYRYRMDIFFLQWINASVIVMFLVSYVVFDEQRYFMPLLPFICLIASSWIHKFSIRYSSFGRY